MRNRTAYLDAVLEKVQRDSALTSNDLPPVPGKKRNAGDWHRSIPRWALEFHFARGGLAVSHRLPNFQRVYDLPERLLPAEQLQAALPESDARKALLRCAARALGIGTLQDLADYFRMSPRKAAPLVQELVEEGELRSVVVENWAQQAFLSSRARLPREIKGASLLSPFDPVVWFRPRAERLFGFHYRIEIYVPAAKRRWGYYVLPFRCGDRIVARVDLKADRQARQLRILSSHLEEHAPPGETAAELARELRELQQWLELDGISVARHNPFSRQLAKAI